MYYFLDSTVTYALLSTRAGPSSENPLGVSATMRNAGSTLVVPLVKRTKWLWRRALFGRFTPSKVNSYFPLLII